MSSVSIVNLSAAGGLTLDERRKAAKWIAQAFADAPAPPALTIFFAAAPYSSNRAMHEAFWASHLHTVAQKGILLGAKEGNEWRAFRCFFPPHEDTGKPMSHYEQTKKADGDESNNEDPDWATFLQLAGEQKYTERLKEWRGLTAKTEQEMGIALNEYFTTSIIVVDPAYQRKGIGKMIDDATQDIVRKGNAHLFVRIHQYILSFYESQGYKVLTTQTYLLQGCEPFKVHFLLRKMQ